MDINPRVTLHIQWARQGQADVEEWWIRLHGSATVPDSGLDEHISFANYALRQLSCPTITRAANALTVRGIRKSQIPAAEEILRYHGFDVHSTEDYYY